MRSENLGPVFESLRKSMNSLTLERASYEVTISPGTSFDDWAWHFPYGVKFLADCDRIELLLICKELAKEVQKLSTKSTELDNSIKSSVLDKALVHSVDPAELLG